MGLFSKKKKLGYQDDFWDDEMTLDLPFSQLNARGRKAKKKKMKR